MDLKKQITFVLDFYWLRYKPYSIEHCLKPDSFKTNERPNHNILVNLYFV